VSFFADQVSLFATDKTDALLAKTFHTSTPLVASRCASDRSRGCTLVFEPSDPFRLACFCEYLYADQLAEELAIASGPPQKCIRQLYKSSRPVLVPHSLF
jgi:hypothetical protein